MSAAIYFHPDGYVVEGREVMGRRMAGAAFLRAAVEGRGEETLAGFAPQQSSGDQFCAAVRAIDPAAKAIWIPGHRLDQLAARRVLYRPDNVMGVHAKLRLRAGPAAFSICGITHTISTDNAMNGLVDNVAAPVMAWDALICTSSAVRRAVEAVMEAEADYQRWAGRDRFLTGRPQLPVIPLGVHTRDFAPSAERRAAARMRLVIEQDEIAFLFAGRLSFTGKAHPYAMLLALQAVAERSGRRIVLIQAGQFSHAEAGPYYRQAVGDYCPGVRSLFVDGADFRAYAESFAAADVFISLADSVQESFGLTPVEAMAAGLPVVVTDWDGYKDTVRDGIDGYRIRSFMPAPGTGEHIAMSYDSGIAGTELYQSRISFTVSVDIGQLIGRLLELTADGDLRRRMGEAGRARALAEYDWSLIYRRYRELWAELDRIRERALADPDSRAWLDKAPRGRAARPDPYRMFAGYSTHAITLETLVRLVPGANGSAHERLSASYGFGVWKMPLDTAAHIFAMLGRGSEPIARIAEETGLSPHYALELIARLAKMNLVTFDLPAGQ